MVPVIPLLDVSFFTPSFAGDIDTVSMPIPTPLVGISRTWEANKKETQAPWGSDLALRLLRRPRPLLEGDPIMQQRDDSGVHKGRGTYTQDFIKSNSLYQNSREYKLSMSISFPPELPEFIEK
jgi:hypothetical protein